MFVSCLQLINCLPALLVQSDMLRSEEFRGISSFGCGFSPVLKSFRLKDVFKRDLAENITFCNESVHFSKIKGSHPIFVDF